MGEEVLQACQNVHFIYVYGIAGQNLYVHIQKLHEAERGKETREAGAQQPAEWEAHSKERVDDMVLRI